MITREEYENARKKVQELSQEIYEMQEIMDQYNRELATNLYDSPPRTPEEKLRQPRPRF